MQSARFSVTAERIIKLYMRDKSPKVLFIALLNAVRFYSILCVFPEPQCSPNKTTVRLQGVEPLTPDRETLCQLNPLPGVRAGIFHFGEEENKYRTNVQSHAAVARRTESQKCRPPSCKARPDWAPAFYIDCNISAACSWTLMFLYKERLSRGRYQFAFLWK